MKKTIMLVLMAVILATPCFAQDVEPEGIFSIEGTRWEALPMGVHISPFPPSLEPIDWGFGFYGGEVYGYHTYFCIDMIVCSIFFVGINPGAGGGSLPQYFGILQPIGIGIVFEIYARGFIPPDLTVGILIKTNDNWKPPEFVSVSPNKGEQGTTLTDVTVIGANTYFESGVDVNFSPFYSGMSISNLRIISDTEIKFDLAIETDAPIGFIGIVIQYNDGKESIFGNRVFEILPKTN